MIDPSLRKSLEEGMSLFKAGQLDQAQEIFSDNLNNFPEEPNCLHLLGCVFAAKGDTNNAIKLIKESLEIDNSKLGPHINLGKIYISLKNYNLATQSFTNAINLDSTNIEANSLLLKVTEDNNIIQRLILSLQNKVKNNPTNLSLLNILALANLKMLKYNESLEIYLNLYSNNFDLINTINQISYIYRKLNDLENSLIYLNKSIDLSNSATNIKALSDTCIELSGIKRSISECSKVLDKYPDFSYCAQVIGANYFDIKEYDKALFFLNTSLKINSSIPKSNLLISQIYLSRNLLEESLLCLSQESENSKNNTVVYTLINQILTSHNISNISRSLLRVIAGKIIENSNAGLAGLERIFHSFYDIPIAKFSQFNSESFLSDSNFQDIIFDSLFLQAISLSLYPSTKLEDFLSKLRYLILNIYLNQKTFNLKNKLFDLITSIACQSFINEYIFDVTENESLLISRILDEIDTKKIDQFTISLLSAYVPLRDYPSIANSVDSIDCDNPYFKRLINYHIDNPKLENKLKSSIQTIGTIEDSISINVKGQYESNPYPRWIRTEFTSDENYRSQTEEIINSSLQFRAIKQPFSNKKPNILIAGCGTGEQIVDASSYSYNTITALDISLNSLSYAKRQVTEIGMKNVSFYNMDILNLPLLNKKFDLISSVGVLHHMKTPSIGLEKLLNSLNPGGFINIALYSKLGRKDISHAHSVIKSLNLTSSFSELQSFRQKCKTGSDPVLNSLSRFRDFYSTSTFRDMCFHEYEHCFDLLELKFLIESYNLKFLGFINSTYRRDLYQSYFPSDYSLTNLSNWNILEQEHNYLFSNMYNIWLQKQ